MSTELQQPGTTPLSEILADIIPEASIFEEEQKATEAATEESQPAETEVEETEEETEAEDSESPEDEEQEPEPKQNKEWPESAQKRVDKLTAKLREAEARAEELQAKLASGTDQPETKAQTSNNSQATTGDTLADVWDGDTLTDRANSALNWKQWALENPEGGTLTIDGKEREYSEEQVKRILVNADRLLTVDIPKRREFLVKASQYEGGLRQEFPEFFQTDSEEWKGIVGAFQEIPSLKTRPDGTGLALMLSLGLREFAKLKQGKATKGNAKVEAKSTVKKPAIAPKPVQPAAAVSAPGPKASRANAKQVSVDDVVSQGGDVDALERFFTS